jgi:hypothetical protein
LTTAPDEIYRSEPVGWKNYGKATKHSLGVSWGLGVDHFDVLDCFRGFVFGCFTKRELVGFQAFSPKNIVPNQSTNSEGETTLRP